MTNPTLFGNDGLCYNFYMAQRDSIHAANTQTTYREIVKDVINKYAQLRPSHGAIRLDTIFNEQQDNYALMQAGWDRGV